MHFHQHVQRTRRAQDIPKNFNYQGVKLAFQKIFQAVSNISVSLLPLPAHADADTGSNSTS